MRVLKHYWKGNQAHMFWAPEQKWLWIGSSFFFKIKRMVWHWIQVVANGWHGATSSATLHSVKLGCMIISDFDVRNQGTDFHCIISHHESPSTPTLDSMKCHESHWCLTEVHHHAGMPVADMWEPRHRDMKLIVARRAEKQKQKQVSQCFTSYDICIDILY